MGCCASKPSEVPATGVVRRRGQERQIQVRAHSSRQQLAHQQMMAHAAAAPGAADMSPTKQMHVGGLRLWAAASVGNIDTNLITALIAACDSWGCSRALLDGGASINLIAFGKTAIMAACDKGNAQVTRLLLERGAETIQRDADGNTALAIAVKRGRKDCVSVLMEYKADPNVFNKAGDTPLMIAAAKGRTAIAVILMQNEANSNLANSVGISALMVAAREGQDRMAALLMLHGADPAMQNAYGKRAVDVARDEMQFAVVKILQTPLFKLEERQLAGDFSPGRNNTSSSMRGASKVSLKQGRSALLKHDLGLGRSSRRRSPRSGKLAQSQRSRTMGAKSSFKSSSPSSSKKLQLRVVPSGTSNNGNGADAGETTAGAGSPMISPHGDPASGSGGSPGASPQRTYSGTMANGGASSGKASSTRHAHFVDAAPPSQPPP